MLKQHFTNNSTMSINNSNYQYEIHDSVLKIDKNEWQQLINCNQDLAMNQKLIYLIQQTLSNQAKFWTVTFRNEHKQLISCANLSLFDADIIQSAPFLIKKLIQFYRLIRPNTLKWKILFCGLPIPSGHSHLRFLPESDSSNVLIQLEQVMHSLALEHDAKLIVLKEFDLEQVKQLEFLKQLNFYQGELAPLFVLPGSFKDFNDYTKAVRSGYRRQIQKNIKKFKKFNLTVEHISDAQQIKQRFNSDVYQLYLNTWKKAKEKLECLPIEFFQHLATELPEQIALTLISNENKKPVAFAIGIMSEDCYYNLYTGLDYSLKEKADLYFNLFYQEIDCAFQFNKKNIFLGQTSDHFKLRLGATSNPRYFFVKPSHPKINFIFKYFHKLIFPKLPKPIPHVVFK